MLPLRRPGRLVALALLVVAFMVLLAFSFQAIVDQQRQIDRDIRVNNWFLAQMQIELLRTMEAVQGLAADHPGVTKDIVIERFDVFWSRLPVLLEGEQTAGLRNVEGLTDFVKNAIKHLEEIEPRLMALDPDDNAAIRRIYSDLDALRVPAHDMVQKTLLFDSVHLEEMRKSYRAQAKQFFLLLIALLALGGVILIALYRETTRAHRLFLLAHAAEEESSLARHQLLVALENISQGFILYDEDDRIALFNARMRELHPAVADAIRVGATFEDLIRASVARGAVMPPPGDLEQWIRESIAEHRNPVKPHEVRLSNGAWLLIDERQLPDGRIVGVHTDITEAKRREVALRTATIQAESSNRAKTEFLARMSHELRTPLNAIIGFAEMIGRQLLGPVGMPRYVEYANDIARSSQHLLGIISDVLDISKIEAGRIQLHEEAIVLSGVMRECAEMLASSAAREAVSVIVEAPANLPSLVGDPTKIKQILLNLVSNAVKFSRPGGQVRVAAGLEDSGWCRIVVSDYGIGIAPEDIKRVLEPFGQVDNALNRRRGGTGLGLPIAKALVELHNGTLRVDSTVGTGTTVTLRFPPERLLDETVTQLRPAAARAQLG
jgi:signal transduction histidine kinase